MLLRYLTNEHTIISPATILEQDSEDLPNIGDKLILFAGVLQTFLD